MRTDFLDMNNPERQAAQDHIRAIYGEAFDANVTRFAPLLVTVRNAQGDILCAAGIRTAKDGFFSDTYLGRDFSTALLAKTGTTVPLNEVMEVVSLASTTPFPVLPMLDAMVAWGREQGMTCGVFTATAALRRLLKRTGLGFTPLCAANPANVDDAESWGRYYETDPWVCAFSEAVSLPVTLNPRGRSVGTDLRSEAS